MYNVTWLPFGLYIFIFYATLNLLYLEYGPFNMFFCGVFHFSIFTHIVNWENYTINIKSVFCNNV